MAWLAGMKAVCVKADFVECWADEIGELHPGPIKDEVCTVTRVTFNNRYSTVYLEFSEYRGAVYHSEFFRPVVSTEQSYAIFTEILARENANIPETV